MAMPSKKLAAPRQSAGGILRYFAPLARQSDNESAGHQIVAPVERVEATRPQRKEGDAAGPVDEGAEPLVSEYERKRVARVAMNAQFLRDLGVVTAQRAVRASVETARATKKATTKKRAREEVDAPVATRRSSRIRNSGGTEMTDTTQQEPDATGGGPTAEESVEYFDSSVFRYTSSREPERLPADGGHMNQQRGSLVGFRESSDSLVDPSLRKIYSISFSPFERNALVATGGHQGHMSVYAAKTVEGGESSPLLSFRAHRGWISCLSLARSTPDGRNLLLSAANDGIVKLWDLNQSVSDVPKELTAVDDLHRTGIFGMDVSGNRVLTCSKDSTIALAQLDELEPSMRIVRRYEEHDGVVKSARFCPVNSHMFASGGNDRDLRVYDGRSDRATASQVIADAHARAINSVVWHPTIEHLLLSASFDPEMHLYDLRHPSKPLQVFNTAYGFGGGSQSIFHPSFVSNGDYVVSTGASSQDQLILQRTLDGATIGCGQLPAKASYVAVDRKGNRLLIAMGQRLQYYDFERQRD